MNVNAVMRRSDAAARRPHRVLIALALALAVSLPLAACGKRGDPEHPGREGPNYPRTYPDPATYPPN